MTPNLTKLRIAAREIFDETLRAVDAGEAVRRAVHVNGSILTIRDREFDLKNRRVYAVALGKAALSMASALEDRIDGQLAEGLSAGPIAGRPPRSEIAMPPRKSSTRWCWFEAGHPLPTKASLTAAAESFSLLERANEEGALVVFLISGGGSAMLEWPIDEAISLADLRAANKALVSCGASISEINAVRRGFSAIKGGRLAARAPNCDQITLIVSDVPADEERNVASGPTIAPMPNSPKPLDVIARYGLSTQLPEAILRAVESESESFKAQGSGIREHFVLLSNATALDAAAEAARSRGFVVEVAADISDQPIETGCEALLTRLKALCAKHRDSSRVVCLISGGEFACPVKGQGIGGRSLETALRLACSTNLSFGDVVALCAGTDGIDGNSPAAGAMIDSSSIERARSVGIDAQDFLQRSDSYSLFVALGDAITTGPTGTNVRDIRVLLAQA